MYKSCCSYYKCLLYLFLPLQIWALQDGTTLIIGGKTNRAKGEFPSEMNRLLDLVPEIVNFSEKSEILDG